MKAAKQYQRFGSHAIDKRQAARYLTLTYEGVRQPISRPLESTDKAFSPIGASRLCDPHRDPRDSSQNIGVPSVL